MAAGLCVPRAFSQTPEPPPPSAPSSKTDLPTIGPATPDPNNPDNWREQRRLAMLDRVIANQKKNDEGDSVYEHIEKKEIRKGPASTTTPEIRVTRNVPAGTGVDKIAVGPDGKPTDMNAYRAELEKLVHSLAWASKTAERSARRTRRWRNIAKTRAS